jgi:MFS transporter, DHA2 family, multidrug resistance protein
MTAPAVPYRTWAVLIGAMLAAFMASLNGQTVSASMAEIAAAVGGGPAGAGLTSTAYLVAEIVVVPLTPWLARVFSVRLYLTGNVLLFVLFSLACAQAHNPVEMIVLRALQGFTGGTLFPMAFMLISSLLPQSRRAVGFAMSAFITSLAPAIGPVVGGWLTANWGWQYVFYLNLVPGALVLVVLWLSVEREPLQLALLRQGDWRGIAAMAIGLASLQVVLEEGSKYDWFASPVIVLLAIVAAGALAAFVRFELVGHHPLLNLRLLMSRTFGGGVAIMFLLGVALYGSSFMLPVYLARVQGYHAEQIGHTMAWVGVPQLLLIPLLPFLMSRLDRCWLAVAGLALFAASNFMTVAIDSGVAAEQLMLPNIVRAIGVALLMTPLTGLITAGIKPEDAGSASTLSNVGCDLGGAIGIAFVHTFLVKREQFHCGIIRQSVSMFDEAARERLDALVRYFLDSGVIDPAVAGQKAMLAIAHHAHLQGTTMAFGDTWHVLGLAASVALVAIVLLLKMPAARHAAHQSRPQLAGNN